MTLSGWACWSLKHKYHRGDETESLVASFSSELMQGCTHREMITSTMLVAVLALAVIAVAMPLEKRQAPADVPDFAIQYAPLVYLSPLNAYRPQTSELSSPIRRQRSTSLQSTVLPAH